MDPSNRPTRIHRASFTAFVAVLLSGCLTIEENYVFKKDGSGTMEYVVDISEMMELFKGLDELGDGKNSKDTNGDEQNLTDQAAQLKKIPGIKKVKARTEKDGGVQRLTFRFADLAALNKALNQLMPDSTGVQTEFFRWEGPTLVRANNRFATAMGEDLASDPDDPDSADATGILQSMKYRYSFTFAEPILAVDIAEGVEQVRPEDRSVKLGTDWSVIMQEPKSLDLRITLAR